MYTYSWVHGRLFQHPIYNNLRVVANVPLLLDRPYITSFDLSKFPIIAVSKITYLCECVCGMFEFPAQMTHVISLEKVVFWLVFHQLCHVGNAYLSSSDQMMSVVNWTTWHNWWNTNQKTTFSKEITCVIWAGNSNIPHTHSHKYVVLETAINMLLQVFNFRMLQGV